MRIIQGIICLIVVFSCTTDYDLSIPYKGNQIVLNGILNPDSILKIKLSFSQDLTDTTAPENIENASVQVLENGSTWIELHHNIDGEYISDARVKRGNSYRILVNVDGYVPVEAEDWVPLAPVISACYRRENNSDSYDARVDLDVFNDQVVENRYWFDVSVRDYKKENSAEVELTKLYYLTCADLFLDNFNSSYDNTLHNFYYTLFMRQSDESKNKKSFPLTISGADGNPFFRYETLQALDENQALYVSAYNCSAAYDRYLKSTLIEFLNNELYDMSSPINGPVKIYSNVKNGLGIFAAYSVKTIEVNKNPCN